MGNYYSMALSLALRMLMLASTAASMQSTMSTRAQPASRQAVAVVRWRSSRPNHAAARELATHAWIVSPPDGGGSQYATLKDIQSLKS